MAVPVHPSKAHRAPPAGHQAAAEPLLPGPRGDPGRPGAPEHPGASWKPPCRRAGAAEEVAFLQRFSLKIVNCCMPAET